MCLGYQGVHGAHVHALCGVPLSSQAKLDERGGSQLLAVLKDHADGIAKLQVSHIGSRLLPAQSFQPCSALPAFFIQVNSGGQQT
jgi:hypothetical protein